MECVVNRQPQVGSNAHERREVIVSLEGIYRREWERMAGRSSEFKERRIGCVQSELPPETVSCTCLE
jgi:hypothetical protein